MLEVSNCSPEMAVPMTVKMPEPMTAPMPSAVSDHGPRVFLRQCPGSSESRMSLSIDLRASSWLGREDLLDSPCGVIYDSIQASVPEEARRAISHQLLALSSSRRGDIPGGNKLRAKS
jgi:hypothetical protein